MEGVIFIDPYVSYNSLLDKQGSDVVTCGLVVLHVATVAQREGSTTPAAAVRDLRLVLSGGVGRVDDFGLVLRSGRARDSVSST